MPTSLPQTGSLVARWSADDITPVADNTSISSWTSGVGGFVASQATSGNQPKYRTSRTGGKPSVQFGGSAWLDVASPGAVKTALDSQVYTVLIAFSNAGGGGGLNGLFGASAGGNSQFYLADGAQVGRYDGGTSHCAPYTSSAWCVLGNTSVTPYSAGSGTGLERAYMNGGCTASWDAPAPATASGMRIGSPGAAFGSFFAAQADIYEILVYSVALTPTEMLQAQMWMCEKYSQAYPWASVQSFTIFDGDSITSGTGATSIAGRYPYKSAASLGLTYGQWSNLGVGGITIANMATKAASEIDNVPSLISKPVRVAAFEWYNQRGADPTPRNNSLSYLSGRRTSQVKVVFGTSTDTSATSDTDRAAYNSYFDSNHSTATMDAYVAIHADSGIGTETAYANNPSNFSDIVHLSDAGYTILAGLMTTGLSAVSFDPAPGAGVLALAGAAPSAVRGFTVTPSAGALALAGLTPFTSQGTVIGQASRIQMLLVGLAPSLTTSFALTPGAGALALAGLAPSLTTAIAVQPTSGALALAGLAPSLSAGITLTPGAGALALAGLIPSLSAGFALTPGAGALALAGLAPNLSADFTLTPGAGALALAGLAPSLSADSTLTPGAGALALAGLAPSLSADFALTPGAGALALAGLAPSLTTAIAVQPTAGVLTLAGAAPAVLQTVQLVPGAGALALAGTAPSLLLSLLAQPGAGALAVAGQQPAVLLGDAAAAQPGAGALALAGLAPTVFAPLSVQPAPGALALAGLAPSLSAGFALTPGAGALALAGLAPSLSAGFALTPGAGALALDGLTPALQFDLRVQPAAGALALEGATPTLGFASPVAQPGTGELTLAGTAPSVAVSEGDGLLDPKYLSDRNVRVKLLRKEKKKEPAQVKPATAPAQSPAPEKRAPGVAARLDRLPKAAPAPAPKAESKPLPKPSPKPEAAPPVAQAAAAATPPPATPSRVEQAIDRVFQALTEAAGQSAAAQASSAGAMEALTAELAAMREQMVAMRESMADMRAEQAEVAERAAIHALEKQVLDEEDQIRRAVLREENQRRARDISERLLRH